MKTKITNTSGATRVLGFVPPHGKQMDNGTETVIEGDLRTVLASGRNRYSRRREIDSLDAALAAGVVTVEPIADPAPSSSSA